MKNLTSFWNKMRLEVLKSFNVVVIGCLILTTLFLPGKVSGKTPAISGSKTNLFTLNKLSFNETRAKMLPKTCNASNFTQPVAVDGEVVYFICYVACRAAGHSVPFCVNSCSLIADIPIINYTEERTSSKSQNGEIPMKTDISQERIQELKVSVILIEASMFGHTQTIREMLDFGANPNIKISDIYVESEGVFDKKAAFTKLDKNDTPLIAAIKYGAETEVINLLVNRGANVNIETKNGKTPLKLAMEKGREDVIRLLLDSGAK